ncbi:MlaD family protein [Nocardia sp. NPDC057227]|uniref:MlaD family protein n=1 Tax=Nocardia sp. NPDC057227 TaxID=3346056 RepID=UPI00362633BF
MAILFESDDRTLSTAKLFVRGVLFAALAAVAVAAGIVRSQGGFTDAVEVTAVLAEIGDGLPPRSDVKYRGVLVGSVSAVLPAVGGGPTRVRIALRPEKIAGIPGSVTVRVVPSNVFAVPSIQLLDNGPAAPLRAGAELHQDRSAASVQLQTSLTALSRIAAAAGRSPADPTVGILETVQRATAGRGPEALRAGTQLERLVTELSALTVPDGTASTLDALNRALTGLRNASPDLLAAVNQAVIPLRAMAIQRARFTELVTGSLTTTGTVGTGLVNRTGTVLEVTANAAPVLDILAAGSPNFVQMTTSQRALAERVAAVLWRPDSQSAVPRIIVELTPHKQYTAQDCPRYGELAGPSCGTGPPGPGVLGTAPPGGLAGLLLPPEEPR